jgi:alanine-glyoxylate transaminase/(R)-3-amino-2-methylpropionate-pyruvate transaminase
LQGPSYDQVIQSRKNHQSKAIFAYYNDHLLIHQGHKQWLWDHNNKRYLDLFAGIVTVSVGHSHPRLNAALQEQTRKLWHTTTIYFYPSIHEYTQKLLAKFPKELDTVIYTNSGSEANDVAMFISRLYTGKYDIVSLRNGYHGMSPYTMGLTSLSTWKYNVPGGFGVQPTMNPGKLEF